MVAIDAMTPWLGKLLGFIAGIVLVRGMPLYGGAIGLLVGHAIDQRWFARRRGDPYETLGVTPAASDAEIERAWRRLMARHHPDRVAGAPEAQRRDADARARAINAAYDRIRALRGR